MDHFVIKKRHILHLFNDHKEMSAGDIVMEVLSWNSNLFRNNPTETQNQKMALFNHMKRQVKSKYDTLMKMNNGPKKNDELKKFMKDIYTPAIAKGQKNEGIVSPRKRKLKTDLCEEKRKLSSAKKKLSDTQFELIKVQNKYILKEASEEKLQKDLNKELQNTAKLTVDLKEFQNKARHVETLESAVEVKDKALNKLKLSHDKLKEKLKESTFKLKANTKSTAKLNEKLERKTEKIEKLKAKEVEQKNTIKGNTK